MMKTVGAGLWDRYPRRVEEGRRRAGVSQSEEMHTHRMWYKSHPGDISPEVRPPRESMLVAVMRRMSPSNTTGKRLYTI